MIRGSVLSSIFCFIIFCLILYSLANVFYFESSSMPSHLLVKPQVFHFHRNKQQSDDGRLTNSETEEKPLGRVGNNHSQQVKEEREKSVMPPLKIYMYDLPRKFTFGVVEAYLRARGMEKPVSNDSELHYPGNQHSAEWWLYLDLVKPQSERLGSPAIRVRQSGDADVFYVPFFSSLSLMVNPLRSDEDVPRTNYSDEGMQEELMEWLDKQETWQRHRGRDHVIICQDPNALHKVIDRLKNSILLLSDFGRLEPEQGSWVKDVVLPYSHRIASYVHENATLERKTLLFFMGNRYRKEGGKVRDQLFEVLETEEDMVIKHGIQSREGRRLAAQGMRTSKYCLHPAGDTPSACRLFDAIVSLCVPVIVSDEIELPFEDELDYSEFAIFVPSFKAVKPGYLASALRSISAEKLQQYQQQLRKVRKYFEYEQPNGAVDQIWRQVAAKFPYVRTMIHRDRRKVAQQTRSCACICSNTRHPPGL